MHSSRMRNVRFSGRRGCSGAVRPVVCVSRGCVSGGVSGQRGVYLPARGQNDRRL